MKWTSNSREEAEDKKVELYHVFYPVRQRKISGLKLAVQFEIIALGSSTCSGFTARNNDREQENEVLAKSQDKT